MDCASVKTSILNGLATAYESTKTFAIWLGRKVSVGWTEYGVPFFKILGSWLRTGFGIGTVGVIVASILLGFAVSNIPSTAGKVCLAVAAALCFIGAGVALAFGTAVLI